MWLFKFNLNKIIPTRQTHKSEIAWVCLERIIRVVEWWITSFSLQFSSINPIINFTFNLSTHSRIQPPLYSLERQFLSSSVVYFYCITTFTHLLSPPCNTSLYLSRVYLPQLSSLSISLSPLGNIFLLLSQVTCFIS